MVKKFQPHETQSELAVAKCWEDEAAEAPERGGGGGGGEQEDGEAANGALYRLPPRPPSES